MEILSSFETPILIIHFIVCFFLLIFILLQAGKGADMGATFGAGSSQTLFGARGAATLLSKLTTVAAIIFLLTSISLASIHRETSSINGTNSVIQPTEETSSDHKDDNSPEDEKTEERDFDGD